MTVTGQHPIEAESYRIIAQRVDLGTWDPLSRAVVTRVIHASADTGYAETLRFSDGAAALGVRALAGRAPVIADVEMVAAATRRSASRCLLDEGRRLQVTARDREPQLTASAAAMRVAAERYRNGAIVVIGCAPTALFEVLTLVAAGRFAPALVIGLPVGFVGAAEAKAALRATGIAAISNVGERGGSAVAAAALNALARLAAEATRP
jgi:precorrin-8X/cobalt-precorrin-8 methylmutase